MPSLVDRPFELPARLIRRLTDGGRRSLAALRNPREPRLSGPDPATLRGRLQIAWVRTGALGDAPFDALVRRWSEPHRRYHTLGHLAALLDWQDRQRERVERPAELELALWFHDAIQVPGRRDDEERSAALARTSLSAAAVPTEVVDRVAGLVLATAHGRRAATPDEALIADLDLAVLGSQPADYDAYVDQVRAEFGWVPERRWRSGRRGVLEALLDGGVYRTERFREELEGAAVANLRRELATL